MSFNWDMYKKVMQYKDTENIVYNEINYIITEHGVWYSNPKELLEIGWIWYIPPLGVSKFYSDSSNTPDFIYCGRSRDIWLNENYEYDQEIFVIDNTNIRFVYSDVFDKESTEYFDSAEKEITSFTWHPESHKNLKNSPRIFYKNGLYYIRFACEGESFLIREDFIRALQLNNILRKTGDG